MRRQTHEKRWGLVASLLLSILCAVSSCNDNPTGPGTHRDYSFYFADGASSLQLYTWYPASGKIDSAAIRWIPRVGITVSPDGGRLYLADRSEVIVIEAETRNLITQLTYSPHAPVAVSNDGTKMAIGGDDLHVLNTEDYSVLYSDTGRVSHCTFSANSRRVYAAGSGSGRVAVIDFETSPPTISQEETGPGSIGTVLPTPDETKLLLYKTLATWAYSFEVFDQVSDSVIFRDVLTPGAGHIAMTPDGQLAFYTSPGTGATSPSVFFGFKIFDIPANQIDTIVIDTQFFRGEWYYAPPSRLAVTPDGRWLGMLGGSAPPLDIFGYDIEKKELVFRKPPLGSGGVPWYTGMASQGVW